MIRNKIGGEDVPMREVDGRLVVDNDQLRLEHRFCPSCPVRLRWPKVKGWKYCYCCNRMWRQRSDGEFDEQLPLDTAGCPHWQHPLAGPATGPD